MWPRPEMERMIVNYDTVMKVYKRIAYYTRLDRTQRGHSSVNKYRHMVIYIPLFLCFHPSFVMMMMMMMTFMMFILVSMFAMMMWMMVASTLSPSPIARVGFLMALSFYMASGVLALAIFIAIGPGVLTRHLDLNSSNEGFFFDKTLKFIKYSKWYKPKRSYTSREIVKYEEKKRQIEAERQRGRKTKAERERERERQRDREAERAGVEVVDSDQPHFTFGVLAGSSFSDEEVFRTGRH